LTQADPESGWLRGWYQYWGVLTQAYHKLGDYERELEAARRARQQYPDHARVRRFELRALAALGRIEDPIEMHALHMRGDYERELEAARRARQQYPDEPSVRGYVIPALAALGRIDEVNALIEEEQVLGPKGAPADLMWTAAEELRAHGYRAAGMQMHRRRIEWLESRPPEERRTVALRGKLRRSLMLVGRLDEARKLIEEPLEGRPDNDLEKLGILADLAAREGRREEVLRISRVVDSIPHPLGGVARLNDTWLRTTIAVALGDRERAMTLLRERNARHYAVWLHTQFQLEPLWDYPPFQELLRPKG
jgi:tetratricopeptide (TPR) repeat protein